MSKNSYEKVYNFINDQGYKLLSTEYINNKQKLKLKCPYNHIFYVRYDNFKSGSRCPMCYGNMKLSYSDVKEYIELYNYNLLSQKYNNFHSKLNIECPTGHKFSMSFANFKDGHRCPICHGTPKNDIEYIRTFLYNINYQLISKEYKNNKDKLKIKCDKNHIFFMSFNSIKNGRRCPICGYNSTSSNPEKEIQQFISAIYNGRIKPNDRDTIVNPNTLKYLELDVYLPEINKAIEFNGTYGHSLANNDKIKKEQCKNNNIDLLVIEEENGINNKKTCLKVIENFIN